MCVNGVLQTTVLDLDLEGLVGGRFSRLCVFVFVQEGPDDGAVAACSSGVANGMFFGI